MKKKILVPYILSTAATIFGAMWCGPSVASSANGTDTAHKKEWLGKFNATVDSASIDTLLAQMEPFATQTMEKKQEVLYIMNTGDTIRRVGGTRAWRNNNPGCLVYGKFARENGAIGKGGKFAVFPDEETGRNALAQLLRGDGYKNLSIGRAITKYAPPYENDVATYRKRLRSLTGVALTKKLCQLDSTEMERVVDAICEIEGWREGQIEYRGANRPILASTQTKLMADSLQKSL